MRSAEAGYGLHLAEEVVEHVAPVAQHVEDDAAAVFLPVIPGRALRGGPGRLRVALEHPVAELAAHRENFAEEALVAQARELAQAGQPQLVLHHAVLHARLLRRTVEVHRLGHGGRDGLLAIHVLAGPDRPLEEPGPQLRGGGIEEHLVFRRGERGVEVGGPARHAVLARERLDLRRVPADEQGIGHEARAVPEGDAALPADLQDRAHEVLVHAHAPGDAVHDDADASGVHAVSLWCFVSRIAPQSGIAWLAYPVQSSEPMAIMPSSMRTRTAPWLLSYRSGCAARNAACSACG